MSFRDLGAATSAVTLARALGASVGVAVLGAIFNSRLADELSRRLGDTTVIAQVADAGADPVSIGHLPLAVRDAVADAYAASVPPLFLAAFPIALLALAVAWRLPDLELKATSRAPDLAHSLVPTASPATASSLDELARSLSTLMTREERFHMLGRLARDAGIGLTPRQTWTLLRLAQAGTRSLPAIATRFSVPLDELRQVVLSLLEQGMVSLDEERLSLTTTGRAAVDRLVAARRDSLARLLSGWAPEEHDEVLELVRRLALELVDDDSRLQPAFSDPKAAGGDPA